MYVIANEVALPRWLFSHFNTSWSFPFSDLPTFPCALLASRPVVIGSLRPDSLPRHLPFLPFPFSFKKNKEAELANFGSVGSGLNRVEKKKICLQWRYNQTGAICNMVLMTGFEKAEGQLRGSQ